MATYDPTMQMADLLLQYGKYFGGIEDDLTRAKAAYAQSQQEGLSSNLQLQRFAWEQADQKRKEVERFAAMKLASVTQDYMQNVTVDPSVAFDRAYVWTKLNGSDSVKKLFTVAPDVGAYWDSLPALAHQAELATGGANGQGYNLLTIAQGIDPKTGLNTTANYEQFQRALAKTPTAHKEAFAQQAGFPLQTIKFDRLAGTATATPAEFDLNIRSWDASVLQGKYGGDYHAAQLGEALKGTAGGAAQDVFLNGKVLPWETEVVPRLRAGDVPTTVAYLSQFPSPEDAAKRLAGLGVSVPVQAVDDAKSMQEVRRGVVGGAAPSLESILGTDTLKAVKPALDKAIIGLPSGESKESAKEVADWQSSIAQLPNFDRVSPEAKAMLMKGNDVSTREQGAVWVARQAFSVAAADAQQGINATIPAVKQAVAQTKDGSSQRFLLSLRGQGPEDQQIAARTALEKEYISPTGEPTGTRVIDVIRQWQSKLEDATSNLSKFGKNALLPQIQDTMRYNKMLIDAFDGSGASKPNTQFPWMTGQTGFYQPIAPPQ